MAEIISKTGVLKIFWKIFGKKLEGCYFLAILVASKKKKNKIMNYEKAYKEAIESIKRIYEQADSFGKELMEKEFPELKESEDEKIVKNIIAFIKENYPSAKSWIVWLEKQGEHANFRNMIQVGDKVTKNEDGVLVNLSQLKRVAKPSEKQGEQKLCMIQWKGDNLKEVIGFTGKNKNFNKWFTSFEEYERYVHEHNNIFKLFNEDGSHYEVPVGAWIVKTPDGYNVASKAVLKQKPADKVEPKFRVGDWVRAISSGNIFKILSVNDGLYRMLCYDGVEANYPIEDVDYDLAYWAIQDAKDGDVLAYPDGTIVLFKYRLDGLNSGIYMSHILLATKIETCQSCAISKDLHPATKEQCDLLFQKMKETGYEWDAEKKELKKIKLSCYHDDGLYYAIDILEKTLGKVEGYQSDDGKMEHQIAIETVNALYNKKPAEWSEEDESNLEGIINEIEANKNYAPDYDLATYDRFLSWLKSLKSRVPLKPKQEWSEEDERRFEYCKRLVYASDKYSIEDREETVDWLKSLKPQNHWKPSEEQMRAVFDASERNDKLGSVLRNLYDDLRKI